MLTTATRLGAIEESATVAIADKSRKLKAAGVDVIDLGGGDPDFPTPGHIVEAAHRAMQEGFTHYVGSRGIPELLAAIGDKLRAENRLPIDNPQESIIVTPSAKFALGAALLGLLNSGDEVIVPDPGWVSYDALIRLAGGVPVHLALAADAFRIEEKNLRAVVTPRTKAILINSPNNPTGHVLSEFELSALADVAEEADLVAISDEIYEKFLFDGAEHRSFGALPRMAGRTITVNGFSKTYAMTGWRLGYLAGPPGLVRDILKVHQHFITCAPSFIMKAGVTALRGPQQHVEEMVAEYSRRRALVVRLLNETPGIRCPWPDGAFYVFPQLRLRRPTTSVEFAGFLLEHAHVAVTPGTAFGQAGEGHFRIALTTGLDKLKAAVQRIRQAVCESG